MRAALLVLLPLLGVAACTATEDDSSVGDESAISADPNSIRFYLQKPLAVQLGQAIKQTGDDGSILDVTCVDPGRVHSELDTMHELGSNGLGFTQTFSAGLAPDGHGPGFGNVPFAVDLANVPEFVMSRFAVNGVGPQLILEDVDKFETDTIMTDTRFSGIVQLKLEHNNFSTGADAHKARTGPECGDKFVRTIGTARFFSYAFHIDFTKADDARAFEQTYRGIDALLVPNASLKTFLLEKHATVGVNILAPSGFGEYLKSKLAGDRCDVNHLLGCVAMNKHLYDIANDIGRVPGTDDTLDAVMAPGSTWGVYSASLADYAIVPPFSTEQ